MTPFIPTALSTRPFIFALFLALACALFNPVHSLAQTGKSDSTRTLPADSIGKQNTDDLIAKAKGDKPVGPNEKVEIESTFPGGNKAWANFLGTNLVYPKKAVRKRIEGTVLLQFIVDKDGAVSDLRALSGDPLLAEAALKAMAESPRWKPAMQNGKLVKSYKKQPIVFKLEVAK
jgi:TonB family protein